MKYFKAVKGNDGINKGVIFWASDSFIRDGVPKYILVKELGVYHVYVADIVPSELVSVSRIKEVYSFYKLLKSFDSFQETQKGEMLVKACKFATNHENKGGK